MLRAVFGAGWLEHMVLVEVVLVLLPQVGHTRERQPGVVRWQWTESACE
jgi:hypothetical protein